METIIAVYKFEVKTRNGGVAATRTRLKWIATRGISLVHIIPYRERRLSLDTTNTVALILAFLCRVGPLRPKAGIRRGEKDFGRTYTDTRVCTCICVFLD